MCSVHCFSHCAQLAWVLVQFDFFICPKIDMLVHPAHCPALSTMTLTTYELPSEVVSMFDAIGLSITSITVYPMQLHALVLAAFGSLIAPFGGFAASGFKVRRVGGRETQSG